MLLLVGADKLCKVGALRWLDLDWSPSSGIRGCSHIGEPHYILCCVFSLDMLALLNSIYLLHYLKSLHLMFLN